MKKSDIPEFISAFLAVVFFTMAASFSQVALAAGAMDDFAPDEIVAAADYVTELVPEKHPYYSGTRARKGIEY